jgi:hypothetical protein
VLPNLGRAAGSRDGGLHTFEQETAAGFVQSDFADSTWLALATMRYR